MPTDIAQRIARWHPIVLTAAFVAGALAQWAFLGVTLPPWARGVLMLTSIGPFCVWPWAVFRVSQRASVTAISGHWDWVFAMPPAIAIAAGFAGWSTNNSPAAFATFLSFIVGLYLAAKTLENVDAATGSASFGRMLGTALLMYLAPLGVWVLRPRVLRAAARTPSSV